MTDLVTLQARLTEAENSYHTLVTGGAARVFVDQNGERIEYAVANAARLGMYIQELKRQLGKLTGGGPLRVFM